MICKLCQSSGVAHKFNLTPQLEIFSCTNCEVQFMSPQLNDEELTELYSETYYKSWGIQGDSENESAKQMKIATFLLRLKKIKEYVASGKVLDVGCATGFFLEAARDLGYETYGVELSEYSSQIAKKKFGNGNIVNGTLENATFQSGLFNVISMFDLIEHVRVPLDVIKKAGTFLDKEGIIIITTPDTGSLSHKLMRSKWTHYKKEHFYYFNLQALKILAEQANMRIVYQESSKKALNIDYLHTQLNVYRHWLFTPLINIVYIILPSKLTRCNFHISIGEITVILKNKKSTENTA
jgi:2-polyprenyl-3-methyl-5-hydroxy-6-metoxy-1,4-benzoquinol methylase